MKRRIACLAFHAACSIACGSTEPPTLEQAASGSAGAGGCPAGDDAQGAEIGDTILDFSLSRRGDAGAEQPFRLHALRSCERPGLLVVRVEPAWCSPCGMRADAVAGVLSPFPSADVETLTVLYANHDNALPSVATASSWRAAHPALPGIVARSSDEAARVLVKRGRVVPMVFLVDRRTLKISNVLEDPDDSFFVEQIAASLREVGGPSVVAPSAQAGECQGCCPKKSS